MPEFFVCAPAPSAGLSVSAHARGEGHTPPSNERQRAASLPLIFGSHLLIRFKTFLLFFTAGEDGAFLRGCAGRAGSGARLHLCAPRPSLLRPPPRCGFSAGGFSPAQAGLRGGCGRGRLPAALGSVSSLHPFLLRRRFQGGARRPRGAKARFGTARRLPAWRCGCVPACAEGEGGVPLPTGPVPRWGGQGGR